MVKDALIKALRGRTEPLSGETLSRELGVSRAAVWKAVKALEEEGYVVEALPTRGYRLVEAPDVLRGAELSDPNRVVGCEVVCLDTVDSTNDEIKRRAMRGAKTGLVVTSECQTAGKGRRGRSFQSLSGKGLYLSVLLKPNVPLEQVSQLTAWTAVAVCHAIERICDVKPQIKWPNDILVGGKKLCGILTEMGVEAETGALSYVVVGMGTNVSQTTEDFGEELQKIATSLHILGVNVTRRELALALMGELDKMNGAFPTGRREYLEEYEKRCVTLGKEVKIIRPSGSEQALAVGLTGDFRLVVRHPDGGEEEVSSGEVSVRGLLGYQ